MTLRERASFWYFGVSGIAIGGIAYAFTLATLGAFPSATECLIEIVRHCEERMGRASRYRR